MLIQLNRLAQLLFNLPSGLKLRSLDSLHLLAAEIAFEDATNLMPPEPFVFVSSDIQLLRVALARGLVTQNPEDYS